MCFVQTVAADVMLVGNEAAVLEGNDMARVKYKRMLDRITEFE